MILWREPEYFWLLALVFAVGALLAALLRRRAAALAAFAEAPLAARLTPELDRRRWRWRALLRLAALLAVVVALAGPKWGFQWRQMKRQGLDVLVAIDTSRSMLATDVKPNRLERAKLAILDLVPLLEGDRIGLVPFAGSAFLECPLTLDYAAFERSVRSLQVGIIPRGGTSLAQAIDVSLEGFEAREGKYEALILITDGESTEGDAQAAAERAKARGVRIFAVGIGTPEGELLPLGADGFVKDRSGQVVKSRLDEATLKEIALATGGAYAQGIGPALGLDQVFRDHIAPMERREVASALQRQYEERFQWPLGLAIALLVIEMLVPLRRAAGARRAWARRRGAAVVGLCLPFLVGFLDPPGDRAAEGNQLYAAGRYEEAASKYGEGLIDAPASPLLQFNLATALYKQGKYDEALQALARVEASGAQWIAPAAYNAGNARYQIGAAAEEQDPQATIAAWEQALADYKRAMVADPADVDAKFNHELVTQKLAELRRRLEEERQKQEQEEQQEQEQKQQEREQEQEQQEQEQQEQQEQEQQEQPRDQQQPQDHQEQEGQQEEQPPPGEQPEEQQPQPREQGEAQPEAAEPQPSDGAAAQAEPAGDEEEAAAQAVIDTARGEELGPLDIERPTGMVGGGEPARDW